MKTTLLLIFAALFVATSSCILQSRADIRPEDILTVEHDNSSIEDFNRRTICTKRISDIKDEEIEKLLGKVLGKDLELGDGSSYMRLTLTDSRTDSVKYSTEIDYATRNKDADRLVELIQRECGEE